MVMVVVGIVVESVMVVVLTVEEVSDGGDGRLMVVVGGSES